MAHGRGVRRLESTQDFDLLEWFLAACNLEATAQWA